MFVVILKIGFVRFMLKCFVLFRRCRLSMMVKLVMVVVKVNRRFGGRSFRS